MNLSWQPAKGGGFQLRDRHWTYWHAWIERDYVVQYRRYVRQPTRWKWYVWLAAMPGERVSHVAKFKTKRQAMKFAEAAVRIG